jgi:hypothetical protein
MKPAKKSLARFGFVRRWAELTFARDQARKFKHRPSLALTNPAVLSAPQGRVSQILERFGKSGFAVLLIPAAQILRFLGDIA